MMSSPEIAMRTEIVLLNLEIVIMNFPMQIDKYLLFHFKRLTLYYLAF